MRLKRSLNRWDLIVYGVVLIQLTAPMPVYGVLSARADGHVVTTILLAMVGMAFTAISYGRMAHVYPSAGSAFTYVSRELSPILGYITGWGMLIDYILNPLIMVVWCSRAAMAFVPEVPYAMWAVAFGTAFTVVNLVGVKGSARINSGLAALMGAVVVVFLVCASRYILGIRYGSPAYFLRPFYEPATFRLGDVLGGTSIAVLTYIGFDGISTLAEEVEDPRHSILFATVGSCLVIGVLSAIEVYAAQLVWPVSQPFRDVDTAFLEIAVRVGGTWLFLVMSLTLLAASFGSGVGSQLGAARLLYGMGRSNALPASFFGAVDRKHRVPRNNVLLVGLIALAGAFLVSYTLGAEILNFGALTAYMGVNAAALTRFYFRAQRRRLRNLMPPLLGLAICFLLWLSLDRLAKIVGIAWMLLGLSLGAWRTRGFRSEILTFEPVPEEAGGE
jgi:amino acid transporter